MSTDRIERQIEIQADPKRVWELICEPGWWINNGTITAHAIDYDGDLATVRDPEHGTFLIRVVRLDPPHYAAFRWLNRDAPGGPEEQEFTLVEFWLDEGTPDSVTLRVAESGFASLDVTEEKRREQVKDNTEGWELELAAARTSTQQA